MQLKYEFEKVEIDDDIIYVPIGEGAENVHGVLKLNNTGYEIVKLLERDMTIDQITDNISAKYETDRKTIQDYVIKVVDALQEHALVK